MKIIDDFNLDMEYSENFDHISLESIEKDLNLFLESFSNIEIALEEENKESFIRRAWEWIKKILGKLWNFLTGAERRTDKIAENIAKTAGFSGIKEMDAEAERVESSGQDGTDVEKHEEVIEEKPKGTSISKSEAKSKFLYSNDPNLSESTVDLYMNIWSLALFTRDTAFDAQHLNGIGDKTSATITQEQLEKDLSNKLKKLEDKYGRKKNHLIAFSLLNLKYCRKYIRECKSYIRDINNKLDSYKQKENFNENNLKNYTEYTKFITKKYQAYSKDVITCHNAIFKKAKEFAAELKSQNITVESKLVEAIMEEYGIEGVTSIIRNLSSK